MRRCALPTRVIAKPPKLHIEGTLISTDRRNEQILEFFPSIEELQTRILRTRVPLAQDAIHIWRTALSAITPVSEELKAVISADELTRSEKFLFPDLRKGFIAGRALLRLILANYCNCEPEDLRFTYGGSQKPGIESNGRLSQTVAFNLSHSADAIQIAIAAEGSVGIDVEHLGRKPDLGALLAECLTDDEERSVSRMDEPQRQRAFLRYWVHKEAFLKCVGCGFSVSPKAVFVSFCEDGRSVIRCPDQLDDVVLFGRDLPCGVGYIAAVASNRREYAVHPFVL
jgi:4'-phosphopantetheinyl transferase